MTSQGHPIKAAGAEVDERCRVTIDVDLDRPRDRLWHEYLADAAADAPFLEITSVLDTVKITVKSGLVELGLQQPHGVRQALDWLLATIPEVDQRRRQQEDRQRATQATAEEQVDQWWEDYTRSKRA